MPLLIGVLLRAIGWSLIPLGWKLLRGLGFTAVAFVGVKAVMDQAVSPACAGPGRSKRGGDRHALSAHRPARGWQDPERDSGNRH
ncbi:hypothetical protein AO998_33960 [Pseudomonas aeruginosa]|nr:hypothetical protein AO998_33960 [Pseudomonas aeruginosa]